MMRFHFSVSSIIGQLNCFSVTSDRDRSTEHESRECARQLPSTHKGSNLLKGYLTIEQKKVLIGFKNNPSMTSKSGLRSPTRHYRTVLRLQIGMYSVSA